MMSSDATDRDLSRSLLTPDLLIHDVIVDRPWSELCNNAPPEYRCARMWRASGHKALDPPSLRWSGAAVAGEAWWGMSAYVGVRLVCELPLYVS